MDNGVIAKLYKKNSLYDENDYKKLTEYYSDLYPGHEEIFKEKIVDYTRIFPRRIGEEIITKPNSLFGSEFNDFVSDRNGALLWGPYDTVDKGKYKVEIQLEDEDYEDSNEPIAHCEVYANGVTFGSADYYGDSQTIEIDNVIFNDITHNVEITIMAFDKNVKFDQVKITKVG